MADHAYHPLEVVEVIDETPDARSFVLDIPPALEETFVYRAGQFCTFRSTLGGESVVRCYSMSSSPETDDRFVTTVKRVPGGKMSNWMNDELSPGDTVEAMRPAGVFVLRENDAPIVAFAGGSGITPVFSILKTALATTKREIRLIYANRSKDSVIFERDLARLGEESRGRLSIHHHLDSAGGRLDAAACAALVGNRGSADFYVCGPAPFMGVVESGLASLGVGADNVFIERFALEEDADVPVEAADTESVVLRLGGEERTARYQAGDTLLATARRAGLKPPFSCEAGNCATCMARLEKGSVSMRVNNALSTEEVDEGWVLTCQAKPTSREVVVDYDA